MWAAPQTTKTSIMEFVMNTFFNLREVFWGEIERNINIFFLKSTSFYGSSHGEISIRWAITFRLRRGKCGIVYFGFEWFYITWVKDVIRWVRFCLRCVWNNCRIKLAIMIFGSEKGCIDIFSTQNFDFVDFQFRINSGDKIYLKGKYIELSFIFCLNRRN